MPLNAELYEQLKQRFGDVKLANEGESYRYEINRFKTGLARLVDVQPGEQYYIRCPICKDHKQRLTISHVNGQKLRGLEDLGPVTWKVRCFNCDFPRGEKRAALEILLGDYANRVKLGLVSRLDQSGPAIKKEMEQPGELGALTADSAAGQYVLKRGFDLDVLVNKYKMQRIAVPKADRRFLSERLFIPVFADTKLVYWQARDVYGMDDTIPYYICKGGTKSLFNFDQASKANFIVISEGVFDAVTIGTNAVALFGKSITPRQIDQLASFRKPVVVALDPDEAGVEATPSVVRIIKERVGIPVCSVTYPTDWPSAWVERKNKMVKCDAAEVGARVIRDVIKTAVRKEFGVFADELLRGPRARNS
jgi:hypothetical protein